MQKLQVEQKLREMIRSNGGIRTHQGRRKETLLACPACMRGFAVTQENLGADVTVHPCPRCRARFHIDGNLKGYVYNGRRIGTEEFERGS